MGAFMKLSAFWFMWLAGAAILIFTQDRAIRVVEDTTKQLAIGGNGGSSLDFKLAYEQSYGFFDDVPEAYWKMYQERARTAKDHRFKNPLKFWFSPAFWYINNYEPVFTCPHIRRVGGLGDGPKWTCDPHRILKVAEKRRQEHPEAPKDTSHCMIYSIGSAGKFEWENGLMDILGTTCEIHIFDPGNYHQDWMEEKNVHYHRWAITSSYNDDYKPQKDLYSAEFLTFQQTLERLGHEKRVIDILKIDCEFCEWFSYEDFLQTADVRQILIETHDFPHPQENDHREKWPYPLMDGTKYFDAFKKNNFFLYSKEINSHPQAGGNGAEWSYIKLHPDFINGGDKES